MDVPSSPLSPRVPIGERARKLVPVTLPMMLKEDETSFLPCGWPDVETEGMEVICLITDA